MAQKTVVKKLSILTDNNFKAEVLESEIPVLVDFWASWCPPCKMAEPIMQELAEELDGEIKVAKMNVDLNPRTASQLSVSGVPTFMFFNGGKAIASRVGVQSKGQIYGLLKEFNTA